MKPWKRTFVLLLMRRLSTVAAYGEAPCAYPRLWARETVCRAERVLRRKLCIVRSGERGEGRKSETRTSGPEKVEEEDSDIPITLWASRGVFHGRKKTTWGLGWGCLAAMLEFISTLGLGQTALAFRRVWASGATTSFRPLNATAAPVGPPRRDLNFDLHERFYDTLSWSLGLLRTGGI